MHSCCTLDHAACHAALSLQQPPNPHILYPAGCPLSHPPPSCYCPALLSIPTHTTASPLTRCAGGALDHPRQRHGSCRAVRAAHARAGGAAGRGAAGGPAGAAGQQPGDGAGHMEQRHEGGAAQGGWPGAGRRAWCSSVGPGAGAKGRQVHVPQAAVAQECNYAASGGRARVSVVHTHDPHLYASSPFPS